MATPTGIARLERFARVASTQDVVREWLEAGVEAPCVAVADEQTAGRGRLDRTWAAPAGTSLLLSVGLRPRTLAIARAWRVPARLSLALREAAIASGIDAGALRLKWPNDIVALDGGTWRKVAGVLTEGVPGDDRMERLIVGIGLNVSWPRSAFPPGLAGAMTSLLEITGRPVDSATILAAFLERTATAADDLDRGALDVATWQALQLTTGARVSVDRGDRVVSGWAEAPDPESGALVVREDGARDPVALAVGDVVRCSVDTVERGV